MGFQKQNTGYFNAHPSLNLKMILQSMKSLLKTYCMSVANIACLASSWGSQVSQVTAKLAIFATDMLWESFSKFNFK